MATTLYHFPQACSLVTMTALFEIGLPFETQLVNIMAGEHKSPDYLSVNPQGKVPALRVGSRVLAENSAILYHLHTHNPQANLLPATGAVFGENRGLEDLVWCSATLHPITRMVRMPMRFTIGDHSDVTTLGIRYYEPILSLLETRFSAGSWWYGNDWSIVDVYLYWNYTTAASGELDLSAYPAINRHAGDVRARPSFQRAQERQSLDATKSGIELAH